MKWRDGSNGGKGKDGSRYIFTEVDKRKVTLIL